jgi:hypothetical protein
VVRSLFGETALQSTLMLARRTGKCPLSVETVLTLKWDASITPESRHRSPTPPGARSGAHSFLYARAATWIDGTMLRADQVPLSKAESAEASVARYCCWNKTQPDPEFLNAL